MFLKPLSMLLSGTVGNVRALSRLYTPRRKPNESSSLSKDANACGLAAITPASSAGSVKRADLIIFIFLLYFIFRLTKFKLFKQAGFERQQLHLALTSFK